MTLHELVQRAAARLDAAGVAFGHGTTNAFDEAAWLVLWQLGLALDTPLDDRVVPPADAAAAAALVERRVATRQPAAFLTGEAWLHGVPFFADARSLVPRSLIAEPLVDGTLDAWLSAETREVLDLCTGNGSLAVLAAMAWPEVRVTASDVDADALQLARRNVERHGLGGRIELVAGDAFDALAGRRFDLVLCNPPYVDAAAIAALPPEYRAEPALALAGGSDGMDFVRRLLAAAPAHLEPGGVLVLEIGHERAHFEAAFPRLEPVWLETSAGADHVLLLDAAALAP